MLLKSTFFFSTFIILIQNSITYSQEPQTGSFAITSTTEAILGKETALSYKKLLDLDEDIKWSVYVPKAYDPSNPPGILLYQLYGRGMEDPTGWPTAMDDRNMILIRIIGKGGEYPLKKELIISILAPLVLQQRYKIDTNRIYTSSVRGCVNAGAIAMNYPNIIKGAIYINCNPGTWRKKEPELVELMRQNRYYFVAGRDRFKQIDNRKEIRRYEDAGIKNVKFVRMGNLDHLKNLNRFQLVDAIDYLDANDNDNIEVDEN